MPKVIEAMNGKFNTNKGDTIQRLETFAYNLEDKNCIIDLRSLSEFDIEDAKILNTIIKLFGQKKLFIVAGRHYGEIVSNLDFDEIDFGEKTNFFISFGDMDISLSNTE